MTTLSIIGLISFIAVLYSFAEKWHDSKLIKTRNIATRYFMYYSGEEVEEVNRYHKDWHKIDSFIKVIFAFSLSMLVYPDYWLMVLLGLLVLTINWIFDFILNIFMGWKAFYTGSGIMDRIPFWARFILLGIIITAMILIK